MKTSPVAELDLSAGVIAVPPLARFPDLSVNPNANASLIRYVEAGGISTVMYAGNANFYHLGLDEYAAVLDLLAESAGASTWVIPSIGSDYGKMCDQVTLLRAHAFPTALVLPPSPPFTRAGVENGLRRIAERYQHPLMLYITSENIVTPDGLQRLIEEGAVCAVKYGIKRADPMNDTYLNELVACTGRARIVSGLGERFAMAHMKEFGLAGFTSGGACIAPRASHRLFAACRHENWAEAAVLSRKFNAFEDFRDQQGAVASLHDAVSYSGIAEMGPMLPFLSNLSDEHRAAAGRHASDIINADAELGEVIA